MNISRKTDNTKALLLFEKNIEIGSVVLLINLLFKNLLMRRYDARDAGHPAVLEQISEYVDVLIHAVCIARVNNIQ